MPVITLTSDPNKNIVDWAKLPGAPPSLTVIGDVSEETIVDQIEEAAEKSAFVIVDLEGTATLMCWRSSPAWCSRPESAR